MGIKIAENLYKKLGLGEANKYDGIKVYAFNGALMADFYVNGELKSGSAKFERTEVMGETLVKLSTLATGHTLSFSLTIGKKDVSDLVSGYGNVNWSELFKRYSLKDVEVKVVLE